MPRADSYAAEGVIVAVLPDAKFRVELANGHRFLGFGPRRLRVALGRLRAGDRVRVEMSPCDLSKGRIVLEES